MSLLRTAARAHVATRVVGSTHRRQQKRWAKQDAAAAAAVQPGPVAVAAPPAVPVAPVPQAAPAAMDMQSAMDQLRQLGELRDAGVLTEVEFEVQKQRVLASTQG